MGEEAELLDDGDYGKDYYASDNEGDDDGGDNDAVYDWPKVHLTVLTYMYMIMYYLVTILGLF